VLAFIHHAPVLHNPFNEHVALLKALSDEPWFSNKQIQWKGRIESHTNLDRLSQITPVERQDHQQINVRIRRGLPISVRAEQNDLVRLKFLCTALQKALMRLLGISWLRFP